MQGVQMKAGIVEEIALFIQYGVQADELPGALALLQRYQKDALALQLMRTFYASLPETHEEAICRIVMIQQNKGIFLLGVTTARHQYLYLATEQQALLLGEFGQEISEIEPLSFFGYNDFNDFMAKCPSLASCEEYEPVGVSDSKLCPACLVAVGEYHLLGCPVEVCPWCDGQLSRCGCRFEQLGVAELTDEEELEELERILEEKGRIPYTREHRPSYLSEPEDLDG
jgi:hypothetical protein